jgi:hypothetical protein
MARSSSSRGRVWFNAAMNAPAPTLPDTLQQARKATRDLTEAQLQ